MVSHEPERQALLAAQRSELSEHLIYARLAAAERDPSNREVLERISGDELRHHDVWKGITREEVAPDRLKVWSYVMVARVLGLTFGVKLMERGEGAAQRAYGALGKDHPEARAIAQDECEHEQSLIGMIDEERLRYVGSIVLGVSDALVELTGTLAGLTLALADSRLIAMAGLITGVAASLSMAASEYLSTKAEGGGRSPARAAVYTGTVYLATVLLLVIPFLAIPDHLVALGVTVLNAVLVVLLFSFYLAVAKDVPFGPRFAEMVAITLGVAAVSFAIGLGVRHALGVDA